MRRTTSIEGRFAVPVKNAPPVPRLLLAREVAELLRVSIYTVRDQARAGRLPCVRIGRKLLFPRDRILQLLKAGGADHAE
jgi:excisionase family DNA binding protein